MKKTLALAVGLMLIAAPAAFCAKKDGKTKKAAPKETAMTETAPDTLLAPEKAVAKAPETFKVRFVTTKGEFVMEGHRSWSPRGADRFYNMVRAGFFKDVAFFRAIEGFMVQFGIHGSPEVAAKWRAANIDDDASAGKPNGRGYVSFAMAGPNTRTTQMFINYKDNSRLDSMGFTPFAQVVQGMEVVYKLYKGYGESAPNGQGPDQGRVQREGNAYLKKDFPMLDYVKSAALVK
jgi:peptidyl-prolyl cis-trans isomerase A (cyclophilin A)